MATQREPSGEAYASLIVWLIFHVPAKKRDSAGKPLTGDSRGPVSSHLPSSFFLFALFLLRVASHSLEKLCGAEKHAPELD